MSFCAGPNLFAEHVAGVELEQLSPVQREGCFMGVESELWDSPESWQVENKNHQACVVLWGIKRIVGFIEIIIEWIFMNYSLFYIGVDIYYIIKQN